MINREEAQKQLQSLRVDDWRKIRTKKIQELSENLKIIGWKILGCNEKGEVQDKRNYYDHCRQGITQLSEISPEERLEIFKIIFPKFPQTVEQSWQLFQQLPYQAGYQRKAFRSPHNSKIFSVSRHEWLLRLLQIVEGYEQDLPWFAAWTPYLYHYSSDTLGILFAAAINQNDQVGKEIFEILIASAKGEHEIGAMGRHVTRGLLVSSCSEGWEFIEKLLLAAQRQEGLRQVILETIDEAHPEAFKRMIRLILDHNLTRFSSVVRAVDVWLGLGWESINNKSIQQILEKISLFLEDTSARNEALNSEESQIVYLALWTLGFEDAIAAIPVAESLINHVNVEIRCVAVYFLVQLRIKESQIALIPALEDPDLRVAIQALIGLNYNNLDDNYKQELFEQLEKVLPNFPEKEKELPYLVWEWNKVKATQQTVAETLFRNVGKKNPKCLTPYLDLCNPYTRTSIAEKLAKVSPWDEEIRDTLFALVGDKSQWVRQRVIKILADCQITTEEAIKLETFLTRKAGDLRRGILTLLLNQKDPETLSAIQRLLESKKILQRQAGLELTQEMVKQQRQIKTCQNYAKNYQATRSKLTDTESKQLQEILKEEGEEITLENGLGLVNLEELTPITPPEIKTEIKLAPESAIACLQSLDELIHDHCQTPIMIESYQGKREELLGNAKWYFPYPKAELSIEEDRERLPLRDLWENWYKKRSTELQGKDGLELVRVIAILCQGKYYLNTSYSSLPDSLSQLHKEIEELEKRKELLSRFAQLNYSAMIRVILTWLIRLYPPQNLFDFLLDAFSTTMNVLPWEEAKIEKNSQLSWSIQDYLSEWVKLIEIFRAYFLSTWKTQNQLRFWQLIQWKHHLLRKEFCYHNKLPEIMATYYVGGLKEADIYAHLIVRKPLESSETSYYRYGHRFNSLSTITRRKQTDLDPLLKDMGDRIRQRVLEIELNRGDLPTAASYPALALASVEGIEIIIKLLQALGKNTLIRGYTYDNLSQSSVFSRLIRVSFPAEADTPKEFAKQVKAANISQEKLINLGIYAPQWSNYVQEALGWKNYAEAVWWIHAHTKDKKWSVPKEIRDTWVAQVSEQTSLSAQNLVDGAVDVQWFNRIYQSLKGEKWQKIMDAAKYASSSGGHKRSELFAQAMLGEIDPKTLITRVTDKRHQDAIRALGLLPLKRGKQREKDLLNRYQIIQEFIRTSRKFGSQRQTSEKLAAAIALENLARTAGYPDPQRLEWAMEAKSVADLVEKPQTVTIDEVSVSLSITDGEPVITVLKQDKKLKSIPAKINKNPEIKQLKARKQQISRQASRMKISLEEAMCRGDNFTASELQQLCNHPVLSPILTQLVFMGEGEIGYPIEQGKALQNHQGEIQTIQSNYLRVAHPYDLLKTDEWHLWQQECFAKERQQPFKQIFRELYLLTPAEQATKTLSNRYEGHQVNPRQALALLGKRGWVTCPEEGVRKTFHKEGISVWLFFLEGFYTPAEVDGLTLEGISFTKRGEWKSLNLEEVSPRLFSEVMRDLDLVVSVAHQGGVDPEASLSTVEMRSTLVRETSRLLKLNNVQLQNSHVLIKGKLGSYSVHLGSAVVHRQPGGSICIIPVHSQHRGRLFLPFADDDPKTAEVVSKVLLLAKDQDIKDPTILEQLL